MNIWTPCLLFSKRQMIFILTTIFSIVFYRLPERDTEKVFWEKIDKWMLKFECFCAWFYCPNSDIAPKTSPYDQLPHTFCHRQSTYIYLFHLYLCVPCCCKCICDIDAHMFTWMWRPEVNFVVLQEQPILFLETVSLTRPRSGGVVKDGWKPHCSRYPPICASQCCDDKWLPQTRNRNTGPTKLSP